MQDIFIDKKFRAPRKWSNQELRKFSSLFKGKLVNVSAWKDSDKEGLKYKDYFIEAHDYWLTNLEKDNARGYQGNLKNEIILDLRNNLPKTLEGHFDAAFNHTTIEHIFEVDKAFENLCKISKDIVILIVPFLQEQHAPYGDFWRFTPLAVKKLFKKNGMELIYINFNNVADASIYIFAIGSKMSQNWQSIKLHPDNKINNIDNLFLGTKIIKNYSYNFKFCFTDIYKRFSINFKRIILKLFSYIGIKLKE